MPEHALPMMRALAPQPPVPPEIEGFLKKLKRKTSNLTGSWNKRWFFVDPRRLEFGYAASRAPNAPKSSIYLNDITAVIQFDETHFQVESRTRNFFLCGESKASTTCWVQSLDEYRKKLVEFEKDMLQRQVAVPVASIETAEPVLASNQLKPAAQKPAKSEKKRRPSTHDANPARDSLQDSSSLSISASSSSNLTDDKPPRHHGNGNGNGNGKGNALDDSAACDEPRTASPTQSTRRRESNKDNKPRPHERGRERDRDADHKSRDHVRIERDGRDRERRSRDREREGEDRERRSRESERERERSSRDRDRARERDRDRDRDADAERGSKRDHSSSSQRRGKAGSSASGRGRTGSRPSSGRSQSHQSQSLYAAHPSHGYVMHAWMDEYE